MKQSKLLYGFVTVLGIVFLAALFSMILQSNAEGTMVTNGLTVTNAEFSTVAGNNSVITLSIENNGDSSVVFCAPKVNGEYYVIAGTNVTIAEGASGTVVILLTSGNYWIVGNDYKMDVYDSYDSSYNTSRKLLVSYQATATPTIEPTPLPESEPFPTALAVASIATISVIGIGILVYFKKYKK